MTNKWENKTARGPIGQKIAQTNDVEAFHVRLIDKKSGECSVEMTASGHTIRVSVWPPEQKLWPEVIGIDEMTADNIDLNDLFGESLCHTIFSVASYAAMEFLHSNYNHRKWE